MITKDNKAKAIKKLARGDKDVGSPEVQVAILTERIKEVTEHVKTNKHDYMAKRGAYAGLTMLLSVFHRFALLDIISSEIIKVIQFRNKRKGEYSQQINIAALNGNFAGSVSFFCIHPLPKTRLHCIQSNTSP